MTVSWIYWVGFFAFVTVMLALDLGVFHRKNETPSIKSSLYWSAFWISLALVFAGGLWYFTGPSHALDFMTAYLLEKSLSVDNLFVFILVFSFFKIAPQFQHRILFWGIFGAIVLRVIFIFAGAALLHNFAFLMYIFGGFLVYAGIKMLFDKGEENQNLDDSPIIKVIRKIVPVSDEEPNGRFFVLENGKRLATPFFLALLFIEASDVVFAVDSVPAALAVTTDTFIVVTSNIFAILGLRSLYFALNGILPMFRYIKYALAAILAFIGTKMIVNELAKEMDWHFHIANTFSLGVLVTLLTVSIVASIIATRREVAARMKIDELQKK
jgi:tellurite resistance protein TerC